MFRLSSIILFILNIWATIDIIKRFEDSCLIKIIWIVIIWFIPVFGLIFYLLITRK